MVTPSQQREPGHALAHVARRHERLFWTLAVVALVLGVSAIGVGIAESATSTASTPSPRHAAPPVSSTAAPSPSTSPTTTTTATTAPASMQALSAGVAIGQSFNTLFDFADGTVTDKLASVQDGTMLRQAMTQAVSTSFANSAYGARVDDFTLLDASDCAHVPVTAPCARITYDVVGANGAVILPKSQGYAVSVDGQWLVAKSTVCGLFELFYQASGKSGTPPGC